MQIFTYIDLWEIRNILRYYQAVQSICDLFVESSLNLNRNYLLRFKSIIIITLTMLFLYVNYNKRTIANVTFVFIRIFMQISNWHLAKSSSFRYVYTSTIHWRHTSMGEWLLLLSISHELYVGYGHDNLQCKWLAIWWSMWINVDDQN